MGDSEKKFVGMDRYHVPVLLQEIIKYLNVKPTKKYIDCTLGGSGHTAGIIAAGGTVLGIDQDLEAIQHAEANLKLTLKQGNFAHLKNIAQEVGFNPVSGILFDLGVSSHQLETDYRGFSFNKNAALDMRMDPATQTITAADLVNAGGEAELANLFWKFGEERDSRKIAKAIVERRKLEAVKTTDELAQIILSVSKRSRADRTHPATRVFQALRIAVNDELASLESALPQAVELLEKDGRLAVISFHSLEDRIIKNFMRDSKDLQVLTDKLVEPTKEEIRDNPRARSGKLRVAEKN